MKTSPMLRALAVAAAAWKAAGLMTGEPAKAAPAPVQLVAQQAQDAAAHKGGIVPPLTDVEGDKEFFGPPFPADYPHDKSPPVSKEDQKTLARRAQPYPGIQDSQLFDKDYVQDENSDGGEFEAQMNYDRSRLRAHRAEVERKRAEAAAKAEAEVVDKARAKADEARKRAEAAAKAAQEAKARADKARADAEAEAKAATDEAKSESDAAASALDRMRQKVKEAEDRLAREKKEFEECQRQLMQAEADVKALKAQLEKMEQAAKNPAPVQTVVISKAASHEVEAKIAAAKQKVTEMAAKLAEAKVAHEKAERELSEEKSVQERAEKRAAKEDADVKQAQAELEAAKAKLFKVRGIGTEDIPHALAAVSPPVPHAVHKSAASAVSLWPVALLLAACAW